MSIKIKLSLTMTIFAVVLLSLNLVLSYFSTRDSLQRASESNAVLVAKQIALAIGQSRAVYEYIGGQNPQSRSTTLSTALQMTSPERIVRETMEANDSLINISGIDPYAPRREMARLFGAPDELEETTFFRAVAAADQVEPLRYEIQWNGERVLESYIPVKFSDRAYVIRVVSSYRSISAVLSEFMMDQLSVSVLLLLMVVFVSYLMAGELIRPLQHILSRVNHFSAGVFDARIGMRRNDEIGKLAQKMDQMADNMNHYMTELRQKNEENRLMREHLESIINQTADAIHVTDLDGTISRINKAFETLYGWTSDEIVGSRLDFIPPSSSDERSGWYKVIERDRPFVLTETVRLRKDGSQVHVSISESPVYDEDGLIVAFISISRDMTEHNKMEELLRRSEKLTTVGQLAAGVAHEIRNPLTTLRGFLQMQQRSKSISQLHTDIMLSELDRINLIVSEFLILAKPQAVQFEIRDIRFTIGDVISLLDSEAHLHNIEFESHFYSTPVLVHCEENQLKQVFINVLKNAMEAMPRGGKISLFVGEEEDGNAVICVEDEGEGISKDRLEKLGEPFYTNKEKGTGLGLMVTQRIIEGHKGKICFDSELGEGTRVTILLPGTKRELQTEQPGAAG
ncbi:PAS domain S-box protein [Paenibacillus sp. MSJ-6]|uniref:PAS domain S-box protein n=2 Tax=Paenibacillus brevis TaxID=2841508 RepID=A0ABS6FY12_9BACL|nr:PAS domain S-box protein [Paenibacillus brevis]